MSINYVLSFSFQVSMGVTLLAAFDCSQVRFNNNKT